MNSMIAEEIVERLLKAESHLAKQLSQVTGALATMEELIAQLAQGVLWINRRGEIVLCNSAAQQLLKCTAEELLQRPYCEHFSDSLFGFSMEEALKSWSAPRLLFLSLQDKKQVKEVEVQTLFHPTGLLLLLRDLTELRHLQSIAERNGRLQELGEMAAALAHEIRNPLGGVLGFAHLLQRKLSHDPELVAMTRHIIDGAQILNRLVSDVLHYARPLQVRLARVELLQLLEKSLALTGEGPHKHILSATKSEVYAIVDRELLQRALLNLFLNGIEAMEGARALRVEVCEEEGAVKIAVCDTGCGIAEEHREKIFSPFFSTKEKGNGLGLAEAQKVVHAHGGTLSVSSEVGKGARFTIVLPCS